MGYSKKVPTHVFFIHCKLCNLGPAALGSQEARDYHISSHHISNIIIHHLLYLWLMIHDHSAQYLASFSQVWPQRTANLRPVLLASAHAPNCRCNEHTRTVTTRKARARPARENFSGGVARHCRAMPAKATAGPAALATVLCTGGSGRPTAQASNFPIHLSFLRGRNWQRSRNRSCRSSPQLWAPIPRQRGSCPRHRSSRWSRSYTERPL